MAMSADLTWHGLEYDIEKRRLQLTAFTAGGALREIPLTEKQAAQLVTALGHYFESTYR